MNANTKLSARPPVTAWNAGTARLRFVRREAPAPVPPPRRILVSMVFPNLREKELCDAWTGFDLLPAFMRGATDAPLHKAYADRWLFQMGDEVIRLEARMVVCVPGKLISWQSPADARLRHRGCVTFSTAGRTSSKASINLEFEGLEASHVNVRTLERIEARLRDTFEFLETLLTPCAMPQGPGPL